MDLFINILEAFGALVALVFGTFGVFAETTFEKQNGENENGKHSRTRLNRNGKIILAGVLTGGMISLIIKITSTVSAQIRTQEQIVKEQRINDSLKTVNQQEQQFKYQVDTSLKSTLASLQTISSTTDKITGKQAENLALQQEQLYHTQRILTPVNPLSLSLLYTTTAANPAVKGYCQRMRGLKKRLENREEIEREGLIVSTQRNGKVKYIQVRDAGNEFFPNRQDNLGLGIAFDNGGETIMLTHDHLNIIGLFLGKGGFAIDVPTAVTDSVHNISYIITTYFSETGQTDDSVMVHLSCDILDKSLLTAYPDAPAFNSIYDMKDKYLSVYGSLTGIFNLKKIIFITGPDKKTTELNFTEQQKFIEEYLGTRKYYQQKIVPSVFR